ncbi:D-beta-hydroxybutyrate dehydrogenase [Serratia marcescens]|uniref:D-beta-hydroxybutyrate dehydrogenase n=1 Tax=Serratia marcescens TaxID=615 RepID=A0A379Y392_SERMA|nr:D-beta-hydroxybutyrate dehydrogenase [Serratia marcescens]
MGFKRITEMTDAQWQGAMDSNLNSAFASARACLPELIKSGGNLLFVASIASLAAGPEVCGYVTAKHALIGLMRSIARDYGPLGVRANAVCPGWVTTPMADEEMQLLMDAHQISLEQAYQMVCRDVPLRRPASAEEIAASAVSSVPAKLPSLPARRWWPTAAPLSSDVPTLAFHFPVRSISMSSEAVFIQVGALAEGFAPHSNTLERQHGLAGATLTLRFSDGATQRCRFTR